MWNNLVSSAAAAALALVLVAPLAVAIASGGGQADSAAAEERAVREVVELYFKGHATGDGAHWTQAFHPASKLFWIKDGTLTEKTSADFIAGASGKPAADEDKRKRRIVSLDVSNDAAVVKVDLDYPGRHLVDYLCLLRIEGRWRIVNKIFTVLP